MWTRKEMTHILGPRLPYTLGAGCPAPMRWTRISTPVSGMLNEMGTLVDAELLMCHRECSGNFSGACFSGVLFSRWR
jgi:hypothetical protein